LRQRRRELADLASGRIFVLMMTDCAMPGIGEVEALERLPARKVLIITGFPSDARL
jgi:hypothetical protein